MQGIRSVDRRQDRPHQHAPTVDQQRHGHDQESVRRERPRGNGGERRTAGASRPAIEGTSTVPCPFWLSWVPDTSENGTKPTITGSASSSPQPVGNYRRRDGRQRGPGRCRARFVLQASAATLSRGADDRSGPVAAAVTALDPAPTCAAA